jgi:multimeric flavodoxin WrbA
MTRLLAISGSYRDGGAIDQSVEVAVAAARSAGAEVEVVRLREIDIEFCHNCRHCTQVPGEAPGACVLADDMAALIGKIEAADGYILATPTNFFSATALFKRFMERLIPYAYWPWGTMAPKLRHSKPTKKAVLIGSCAAPGLMGRLLYTTLKQLKITASTIGAKPVGTILVGQVSQAPEVHIPAKTRQHIETLARRLV